MEFKKLKKIFINNSENIIYGTRDFELEVPRHELPDNGLLANHAYSLIHDMLMLDSNPRLNLATFLTTWMEPEAQKLMVESFDKNLVDKEEYSETTEIETRCVNILANLWNCPNSNETIGCGTIGSSEACMLAGLAMKWQWRERRKKQNKSIDKPNLVIGVSAHICWEKFCRYWDVELRTVPIESNRYVLNEEDAIKSCDENTIGIVGILGTTVTGQYDPILKIHNALERLNAKTLWEIPLHIDAASGGFVAPFLQPKLLWDFRLKWVKSINTSGHKYGLVYPGIGWIVWRDKSALPEDLIFNVNYLGGKIPTFTLNFSRPGSQIIAQYYNFLRLGRDGYTRIHRVCKDIAHYLANAIAELHFFDVLSDGSDIPVLCLKLNSDANFTAFEFSERLRYHGWSIPAYYLPEHLTNIAVMRIVVREGFTRELADILLNDIKRALIYFEQKKKCF